MRQSVKSMKSKYDGADWTWTVQSVSCSTALNAFSSKPQQFKSSVALSLTSLELFDIAERESGMQKVNVFEATDITKQSKHGRVQ